MYKPQHLKSLYRISQETARIWALEFAEYLSPTARPGKNKHRFFSDEDMRVFSLVSQMKDEGKTFEEIHAALKAGERGEAPQVDPTDLEVLNITDRERGLVLQVDRLTQELVLAREELARVAEIKQELTSEREKNIRLEARYEELKASEDRLQALVTELSRQLGREYAQGYKDGLQDQAADD